jgi:hypothetical protein
MNECVVAVLLLDPSFHKRIPGASFVSSQATFMLQHSLCLDPYDYVLEHCRDGEAYPFSDGGKLLSGRTISFGPLLLPTAEPYNQALIHVSVFQ